MIRLRRILPTQLLQTAQQMTLQQDCLSASLPSAPQLWGGHLQQSSCMATPKPAQKPPSLHERRLANFEYCKARKAWRRQLGKLRTEWLRQYNSRLAHKRQEAEAVKQQMQQLRQLQSTTTQTDRTRDTLDRQLRDAERAYEMVSSLYSSACCLLNWYVLDVRYCFAIDSLPTAPSY